MPYFGWYQLFTKFHTGQGSFIVSWYHYILYILSTAFQGLPPIAKLYMCTQCSGNPLIQGTGSNLIWVSQARAKYINFGQNSQWAKEITHY